VLPVRARAWGISPNNRIVFTGGANVVRHELWAIKNFWKIHPDVEVVGSSNGLVYDLDGVDRWVEPQDAQGWLVLHAHRMGDVQILLSPDKIAFSPSGYQLVGDQPWAVDEQILSTDEIDVDGPGDRIWSAGHSSDGGGFWFFLARGRSIHRFVFLQLCESAVSAPATFDPSVVGFSLDNHCLEMKNCVTKGKGVAYVNGISCPLFIGGESYGGAALAVEVQTSPCQLQGGGYLVQPISVWSETLGARGKVADLVDVWAGPSAMADGDLLPDDGTKQMIVVGQFVIPWDGVTQPELV
jgi:hypothetical protein